MQNTIADQADVWADAAGAKWPSEGRLEIAAIEQDGSGLITDLPDTALRVHSLAPYEHLPQSLTADG